MALQIVDISSNTGLILGTTDNAYIASGAILNTAGTAIYAIGSNQTVIVDGKVASDSFYGIYFGDDAVDDIGAKLEISATGSVFGNAVAVVVQASNSTVINSGTVGSESYAIGFYQNPAGSTGTVINSGRIIGDKAVAVENSEASANITNTGKIIGFSFAFESESATAIDRIYNKGSMQGNISFNGGNDLYDGRGGTFVGTAFGGAGDDTFIGGNGVERFDGGNNNDKFTGGLGKDVLTTGAGIDKIIFNAVTEVGDIVTDFATSDFFQFKKSAFGNLALGTLSTAAYHENTTGAAHDTSDRFIFETDTSRLWYDKDGTGSAAKVLVADMSNTVNISNADIQII